VGGYVYMMASKRNGTLYTGVTAELAVRGYQHREGVGSHFTAKYGVKLLVWYEHHDRIEDAIQREKNIKHWPRQWKVDRAIQPGLAGFVRDPEQLTALTGSYGSPGQAR